MANRHFGEIGDVWKHLPLAEILRIEKPRFYWESHAGSAFYDISRTPQRDYGVYHFLDQSARSQLLAASAYRELLRGCEENGQLKRYPGSPQLALSLLTQPGTHFVLCDLDPGSVSSLRAAAAGVGQAVRIEERDGIDVLRATLQASPAAVLDSGKVFALLDPYDPFAESAAGVSSALLFAELAAANVKVVLWYGFESWRSRLDFLARMENVLERQEAEEDKLFCAEIAPAVLSDPGFPPDSGVIGAGILCANLSLNARTQCEMLGHELAEVYQGAGVLEKYDGTLSFTASRGSLPLAS